MNKLFRAPQYLLLLLVILLNAQAAWAGKDTAKPGDELVLTDSKSALETQISALLNEHFHLKSKLEVVKNDPNDLIVVTGYGPIKEQNVPAIGIHVYTNIISRRRDKAKTPELQIISIVSTANVKVKPGKEALILKLMNNINAQPFPAQVYASGERIFALRNLTLTADTPLPASVFLSEFINSIKVWPTLLKILRKEQIVDG